MEIEDKNYIYYLKSLAIFSVVCAHASPVSTETGGMGSVCSDILNYIGTMGVPVFFLISGYLFQLNSKSFQNFWKGKIFSIFVPWIFCETLLWFYVVVRKGGAGVKEWFLFIIGYDHTTYYMSVLMVLYLLFWIVKKDWQIYLMICLSLYSIISTGWRFGINFVNSWTGNYYLNPLNWIVFFAIGIIISKRKTIKSVGEAMSRKQVLICAMIISISYFVLCEIECESIYYFSKYALISHTANIVVLHGFAEFISRWENNYWKKKLLEVGKYSYTIYLLHQFVVGFMVAVTNKIGISFLVLLRPFAVLIIVMIGIYLVNKVFGGNKYIKTLIGMR